MPNKGFNPNFMEIENDSACFRLKTLVKVVSDAVEVQSTWNLVHMFPMIWSF